ncbi:MAG: hypothetical protein HOJ41_14360 [Rhodospirillaceae bacterium]|nr:hypothetical protein [Rhodospirillaceae bacterium]
MIIAFDKVGKEPGDRAVITRRGNIRSRSAGQVIDDFFVFFEANRQVSG